MGYPNDSVHRYCDVWVVSGVDDGCKQPGSALGNQAYAIGQGLFLWAAVALLGDAAHTALGWREFVIFDHVQMVVYLSVVLFWTAVFWLPEQNRSELSPEIGNYVFAAAGRLHYDRDGLPLS